MEGKSVQCPLIDLMRPMAWNMRRGYCSISDANLWRNRNKGYHSEMQVSVLKDPAYFGNLQKLKYFA